MTEIRQVIETATGALALCALGALLAFTANLFGITLHPSI